MASSLTFSTQHYYSGQGKVYAGSVDPDDPAALPENILALGNITDLRLETEETYHEPTITRDGILYAGPPELLGSSTKFVARLESLSAANLAWLYGMTTEEVEEAAGAREVLGYHGGMTVLPRVAISAVTLDGVALTAFTAAGVPWHYRHDSSTGALYLNDGLYAAIPEFPSASPQLIDVTLASLTDRVARFPALLAFTETLTPGQRIALFQTGMHIVCDIVGWGEDYVDIRYPFDGIPADPSFTGLLDGFTLSVTLAAASTVDRTKKLAHPRHHTFLRFVGINTAGGAPRIVDIFRARIIPSSGWDLIPGTVANVEVEGVLLPQQRAGAKAVYYEERRLSEAPEYAAAV
jgi:hypothetical protein